MKLQNILLEQHMARSHSILIESCRGLDPAQTAVVQAIHREFRPLIEASLTADQIKGLFGEVEKSATAAGGNRTMLGKGVDVAKKVDEIVNNIGKWLQDTKPVAAADQKFEDLKGKIAEKFPAVAGQVAKMGSWIKDNPGKTAAIIGVLTSIASLATGPVGGAIAGQVLRASVELLKGEKLSTAIGKGIKTAAYGFIAGKTFELIGDSLKDGITFVKDNMFPGAVKANFSYIIDQVGGPLGSRYASFEFKDLVGRANDVGPIKQLANDAAEAWSAGDYELSKTLWTQTQDAIAVLYTPEYVAQLASDQSTRQLIAQGAEAVKGLTDFMGAAAQGAVAAGVGSKNKKESRAPRGKRLSEGQVYLVFKRLDEGPMDAIKGAMGKVAGKVNQMGTNLTTKVTADKLNSAWQKAGSPTDSEELAKFLEKQGVSSEIIKTVYTGMKLPLPGAAPAAPVQDLESVKKMVMALPVDRRVRLLKYLQKTPAAPAAPQGQPT
jgi:hypothetical protein